MAARQQTMPFGYAIDHTVPEPEPEPPQAPQPIGSPLLNDRDNNLLADFWDQHDPYSDSYDFLNLPPQMNAAVLGLSTFPFPAPPPPLDAHVLAPSHDKHHSYGHMPRSPYPPTQLPDALLDDSQIGANALFNLAHGSNDRPDLATRFSNAFTPPTSVLDVAQYPHPSSARPGPYNPTPAMRAHRPGQPLPFGTDQTFLRDSTRQSYGPRGLAESHLYTQPAQAPSGLVRPSTSYATIDSPLKIETATMSHHDDESTADDQLLQQPTPEETFPSDPLPAPSKGKKRSKAAVARLSAAATPTTIYQSASPQPPTSDTNTSEQPLDGDDVLDDSSTTALTALATPSQNGRKRRKSSNVAASARPRLTEEQKKERHIHSEQKRRDQIKDRFADLHTLVPTLRNGGFSKAAVLQETVRFLESLVLGNRLAADAVAARLADRGLGK